MGILFCAKVDWSNDVVIQAPRESDKEYARFRFQVEELSIESWMDPVPGIHEMKRPPRMTVSLQDFDPSVSKSSDIGTQCVELKRSQHWCILEWVRLN